MWIAALLSTTVAWGTATDGWQDPTTALGIGVTSYGYAIRGQALFGAQVAGELGAGVAGYSPGDWDPIQPTFDWALYWKPTFGCINCGEQVLATVGIGLGGVVVPSLDADPWVVGVGPDLGVTGVVWVSRSAGLQLSGRVGAGPVFSLDSDPALDGIEPWWAISVGAAF